MDGRRGFGPVFYWGKGKAKDNAEAQRGQRFAEEEGSFDCGLRKAQAFAQDDPGCATTLRRSLGGIYHRGRRGRNTEGTETEKREEKDYRQREHSGGG